MGFGVAVTIIIYYNAPKKAIFNGNNLHLFTRDPESGPLPDLT